MKRNPFENKIKRCFFEIIGDLPQSELTDSLTLTPDAVLYAGDFHPYEHRRIEKNTLIFGYNDLYAEDYNDMLYKTLEGLLGKEELLARLKEKYGLSYVINVGEEMKDELLILDGPISSFIVWSGASKDQSFNFF